MDGRKMNRPSDSTRKANSSSSTDRPLGQNCLHNRTLPIKTGPRRPSFQRSALSRVQTATHKVRITHGINVRYTYHSHIIQQKSETQLNAKVTTAKFSGPLTRDFPAQQPVVFRTSIFVFRTSKIYIRIKIEFFYKWNGISSPSTSVNTLARNFK